MKSSFVLLLGFALLTVNALSQTNLSGKYRSEGWDMFWLAKAGSSLGAPETFSSRGRTVDFNIDVDFKITCAKLEFDYFDGDFLLGINQDYTSFNIIIDGNVVDSVEFQNNSTFLHKSIDVTKWIKENRYSLPVTFSIIQSKSKDGVIIARPYLVLNKTHNIKGFYPTEGWDMFWLAKPTFAYNAPEVFSSRARTVNFNIDMDGKIENAILEFDYFNGNYLIGHEQRYTSFYVIMDGEVVDSLDFQTNSAFIHRSIDVTQWIKEGSYSLPITFSLNSSTSKTKAGVIIARPYLRVLFKDVTVGINDRMIKHNEFNLFPNPTNSEINLNFTIAERSKMLFTIYDSQGRIMMNSKEIEYDNGIYTEKFNVLNYHSGVYFLQILKNEQRIIKTFIVK
jgi:hypothetical protein